MNGNRKNISIALLVSCTKKKRIPVSDELRFSSLERKSVHQLAKDWFDRTQRAKTCCPANKLYCGPSWSASLDALAVGLKRFSLIDLYIVSAGFGLLRFDDSLPSYSAAFSCGVDQIAKQVASGDSIQIKHRSWWREINKVRGTMASRAFNEIVNHDYIIVAAGTEYIQAMKDDLEKMVKLLENDHLYIISTGTKAEKLDSAAASCLLPINSSAERIFGRPRLTLNQRILKWLVSEVFPVHKRNREDVIDTVRDYLKKNQIEDMNMYNRPFHKKSDEEIKDWISNFNKNSIQPKTRLLKLFRKKASCGQSRFYCLFDEVFGTRE